MNPVQCTLCTGGSASAWGYSAADMESQGPWRDSSVERWRCKHRVSSPGGSALVLLPMVIGILQGRGWVRERQRHTGKFLLFDKELGRMAIG